MTAPSRKPLIDLDIDPRNNWATRKSQEAGDLSRPVLIPIGHRAADIGALTEGQTLYVKDRSVVIAGEDTEMLRSYLEMVVLGIAAENHPDDLEIRYLDTYRETRDMGPITNLPHVRGKRPSIKPRTCNRPRSFATRPNEDLIGEMHLELEMRIRRYRDMQRYGATGLGAEVQEYVELRGLFPRIVFALTLLDDIHGDRAALTNAKVRRNEMIYDLMAYGPDFGIYMVYASRRGVPERPLNSSTGIGPLEDDLWAYPKPAATVTFPYGWTDQAMVGDFHIDPRWTAPEVFNVPEFTDPEVAVPAMTDRLRGIKTR